MTATKFASVKENKQWFLDNKKALIEEHGWKYMLIVNKEVIQTSSDESELAVIGRKTYGAWNFCVTLCWEQPTVWINPIITVTYA